MSQALREHLLDIIASWDVDGSIDAFNRKIIAAKAAIELDDQQMVVSVRRASGALLMEQHIDHMGANLFPAIEDIPIVRKALQAALDSLPVIKAGKAR